MQTYMYKNMWTQELEDTVENDKAKPLIMEMFHKYGLQVYAFTPYRNVDSGGWFLMTLDGLPYCKVSAVEEYNSKLEKDELIYVYTSEFYRCKRARSNNDGHTLTSTRIANLIKSMEKKKAVPSDSSFLFDNTIVHNLCKQVGNRFETKGYKNNLPVEDGHILLQLAVGGLAKLKVSPEKLIEYKVLLDKYNLIDDTNKAEINRITSMFSGEVCIMGISCTKGYVIGKIKCDVSKDNKRADDIRFLSHEMVEPFRGVLNLDDYEHINEIRPVLTMCKVNKEIQKSDRALLNGMFPVADNYYKDLEIMTYYSNDPRTNPLHMLWVAIPLEV
jgi:hypothetical protein